MFVCFCLLFFFNDTATTEIYTLSLHDALPICGARRSTPALSFTFTVVPLKDVGNGRVVTGIADRKSTRLNSSHVRISYAVFCLKKKKDDLESFASRHSASPWRQSHMPDLCVVE